MKVINRLGLILLMFVFACVSNSSFAMSSTGQSYMKDSKKLRSKAIIQLLERNEARIREARAYGITLPSEKLVSGTSVLKQLKAQFCIVDKQNTKKIDQVSDNVASAKSNAYTTKKVEICAKIVRAVEKSNSSKLKSNKQVYRKNDKPTSRVATTERKCKEIKDVKVYSEIKINKRVGTKLGLLIVRMQNRADVRMKEAKKYGLKFPVISRKQIHDGSYRKIIKSYCSNVNVG